MNPSDSDLDYEVTRSRIAAERKFFGRYTLQRELGRGGMGLVWLALDEKLDEQVALKFLPDLVARDREAIAELKDETLCCRKLRHPGIVAVYGFEEEAGAAAIVMEYVDGATLSDLKIEQPGRFFEVAQIQTLVSQLCDALDYAHRDARLVHRDIKPRNLMLGADGRLKLMDFGLARTVADSLSRVSVKNAASGTPPYMSPQQISGRSATVADDIYALGATLYDLLTGKPPFLGVNIYEQVKSEIPPRVSERRAELGIGTAPIPRSWDETIAACLAKDPAQRPQSARQVWEWIVAEWQTPDEGAHLETAEETDKPSLPPAPLEEETQVPLIQKATQPGATCSAESPKQKMSDKRLLIAALVIIMAVLGGVGIWEAMRSKDDTARGSAVAQAPAVGAPAMNPHDETPGPKPLRVGMDMSYPPFEMRDTQGQPAGVSVDLALALGENLGQSVVFENMPFNGLVVALKTGRIDVIISSMTATEEGGRSVDFSAPYVRTGLSLLVSAKSDVRGIGDLDVEGKKIAVVQGTTGQLWAKANLKKATVLDLEKETACVLEVTQGKADAFIYDQMSTLRNWQSNPDTTRALLKPFREESWAIVIQKGNAELTTKVNAFLVKFRADGGFDRLGERWLKEQRATFAKLGVPFLF